MAAPKGNTNAAKHKIWELAVRHEIARDRKRLYKIAANVIDKAEAGEQWAVTELRNTLDGKPKEHVQIDQRVEHVEVKQADSLDTQIKQALARRTQSPQGPAKLDS